MEANGTFRLSQAAIESHDAHHLPECASEFFRAVLFLQVSAREVESCVTDSKRSPASLANRGQGAELRETTRRAPDGIKAWVESQ
jgi:hypothetical protein